MNKIPKCRSKYFIPQANNVKISQRDSIKEHLAPKITQKNLKFSANRQFGKDITNSMKGNIHSIYNNHCTKIITIVDKKQNNKSNNNVYIKKHSSASQVAQKNPKIKIVINEKKLRENKSGSTINNKKNNISVSEYYYYKNNNLKNDYAPPQGGSKLHSSISFGINESNRPLSSYNNSISVRLSNPKSNKISTNLNNRSIKLHDNYFENLSNFNNKIELTHSNIDLM